MSEVDEFLEATIPRQVIAERALHNGDVAPRMAMWSRNDPVTVFGAWLIESGWDGVSGVFERIASLFSDCTSYDFEIVAAGASGDLAYTVGYEHTSTSVGGEPQSYTLRVTNVYRREEGEWKLAHRHADRLADLPGELAPTSGSVVGDDATEQGKHRS